MIPARSIKATKHRQLLGCCRGIAPNVGAFPQLGYLMLGLPGANAIKETKIL